MFGTPLDRSREEINIKKFNLDLSPIDANQKSFKIAHEPFHTVKLEHRLNLEMKSKQDGDSIIPDVTNSVVLSAALLNEGAEDLIQIND